MRLPLLAASLLVLAMAFTGIEASSANGHLTFTASEYQSVDSFVYAPYLGGRQSYTAVFTASTAAAAGAVFYYGNLNENVGFGLRVGPTGILYALFDNATTTDDTNRLIDANAKLTSTPQTVIYYVNGEVPGFVAVVLQIGLTSYQKTFVFSYNGLVTAQWPCTLGGLNNGANSQLWSGTIGQFSLTVGDMPTWELLQVAAGKVPDSKGLAIKLIPSASGIDNTQTAGTITYAAGVTYTAWKCGDGVLDAWEQCDSSTDPNCNECLCSSPSFRSGTAVCALPGSIVGSDKVVTMGAGNITFQGLPTISSVPFYELNNGFGFFMSAWLNPSYLGDDDDIITPPEPFVLWKFGSSDSDGFTVGLLNRVIGVTPGTAVPDPADYQGCDFNNAPTLNVGAWAHLAVGIFPSGSNGGYSQQVVIKIWLNGELWCPGVTPVAPMVMPNAALPTTVFSFGSGFNGVAPYQGQVGHMMAFTFSTGTIIGDLPALLLRGYVPENLLSNVRMLVPFDDASNVIAKNYANLVSMSTPANARDTWACNQNGTVHPWEQCDDVLPSSTCSRCVCIGATTPSPTGGCIPNPVVTSWANVTGAHPSVLTITGSGFGNIESDVALDFTPRPASGTPAFTKTVSPTEIVVSFLWGIGETGFDTASPLSVMVTRGLATSNVTTIFAFVVPTPAIIVDTTLIGNTATSLTIAGQDFGSHISEVSVVVNAGNERANCTVTWVNSTSLVCSPTRTLASLQPTSTILEAQIIRFGASSANLNGGSVDQIGTLCNVPTVNEVTAKVAANALSLAIAGNGYPLTHPFSIDLRSADGSVSVLCNTYSVSNAIANCNVTGIMPLGNLSAVVLLRGGDSIPAWVRVVVPAPTVTASNYTHPAMSPDAKIYIYGSGFQAGAPTQNKVALYTSTSPNTPQYFNVTNAYAEYLILQPLQVPDGVTVDAVVTAYGGVSNRARVLHATNIAFILRTPTDASIASTVSSFTVFGGNFIVTANIELKVYNGSISTSAINSADWAAKLTTEASLFFDITCTESNILTGSLTCDVGTQLAAFSAGKVVLARETNSGTPWVPIYFLRALPSITSTLQYIAHTDRTFDIQGQNFDGSGASSAVEIRVAGTTTNIPCAVDIGTASPTSVLCTMTQSDDLGSHYHEYIEARVSAFGATSDWATIYYIQYAAVIISNRPVTYASNAPKIFIPGDNFEVGISVANNSATLLFESQRSTPCYEIDETTKESLVCVPGSPLELGKLFAYVCLFDGFNTNATASKRETCLGNAPNPVYIGDIVPPPYVTEASTGLPYSTATITIEGGNFNPTFGDNTVLVQVNSITIQSSITSGNANQLVVSLLDPLPQLGGELKVLVTAHYGDTSLTTIGVIAAAPGGTEVPTTPNPIDNGPMIPTAPLVPQTPITPGDQIIVPDAITPGGIAAAIIVPILVLAIAGFLVWWFLFRGKKAPAGGAAGQTIPHDAEMKADPWKAQERATALEESSSFESGEDGDDGDEGDDGDGGEEVGEEGVAQ